MWVAVECRVDEEGDLWLLTVQLDDGGVVNVAGDGLGGTDVDAEKRWKLCDGARMNVEGLWCELAEGRVAACDIEQSDVGDGVQQLVGRRACGLVAAEEILGVVLEVLGELPEGQSTTKGGQRGVDEEVLPSFFLEVLPAVWSGHSTNEGEGCPRGSEQLGERVLVV